MCRVHEGNTLGGLMNTLFCTPEQGARLKELLPEIEYSFVWEAINTSRGFTKYPYVIKSSTAELLCDLPNRPPALTLQELRDVAQREFAGEIVADPVFANAFETWVYTSSAPDLAEWLIARLEGKP
jgi:hypothetical protein